MNRDRDSGLPEDFIDQDNRQDPPLEEVPEDEEVPEEEEAEQVGVPVENVLEIAGIFNFEDALFQLFANEQGQIMANQASKGSQLSAIPEFNGDPSKDIELWCELVDNFKIQFRWSDQVTASAAKARLTGKAAFWLSTQAKMGNKYPKWDVLDANANPPELLEILKLKTALTTRFKPAVTAIEATAAVTKLNQKENESVREFYDRVLWAVDLKNYNCDKAADAYISHRDSDIYAYFSAGLKEKIIATAMSGGDPPATHATLLNRAATIELAMEKTKQIAMVTASPGEESVSGNRDGLEETVPNLADLAKQVAALSLQGANRGNMKCHRCNKEGHFIRNCPDPPRRNQGFRGGRRGRAARSRGRARGWVPQAYFGQRNYDPQRTNFGQGQGRGTEPRRGAYAVSMDDFNWQGQESENY